MKIATFNSALLSFEFYFLKLKPPTKYLRERKEFQLKFFMNSGFDIILFQEIYHRFDSEEFVNTLSKVYPFYFKTPTSSRYFFQNDLMIFSKFPIIDSNFFAFNDKTLDEWILANKGFIKATIESPIGIIDVFNLHLTAGGIVGPESFYVNKIRSKQIKQILNLTNPSINSIIAGDFNCGIQASKVNYNEFLDLKWINNIDEKMVTWDPENNLNKESYHQKSPPQQIDHIFLSHSFINMNASYHWDVFGNDLVVTSKEGKFTMSDHSGVWLEINKN